MKKNHLNHSREERMSLFEKLVASSGGIVGSIDMMMVQTFLLYFYTDVMKVSVTFAGIVFLVVRIVSAIAAPVFGIFIDKTITPWGKYRPYYIILGVPTAIFGYLTFTNLYLGSTGKYIYIFVTYFCYSLFNTIGGVSKGAMAPTLTKNIQDRLSLGMLGYVTGVTGAMIATIGAPLLIKAIGGVNESKGFSMTMALFAILAITLAIVQGIVLKEKYPVIQTERNSKVTIREMMYAVFSNKMSIIILLMTLSINLSVGLRSAVSLHYLKYYFKQPEMMAQIGLLTVLGLYGGAMLSPIITRKIGLRMNLLISTLVTILSSFLIYVIPAKGYGIYFYILLMLISNFFNGLSMPAQSTLMPNAIDYCECKTGINVGAFMSSINSFVATAAMALSGVIVGVILSISGYQANAELSNTAITAIKLLISILPAIASIFTLSSIWLGDTEKQHEKIVIELMERRSQQV